jgi:hypothetical protein
MKMAADNVWLIIQKRDNSAMKERITVCWHLQ